MKNCPITKLWAQKLSNIKTMGSKFKLKPQRIAKDFYNFTKVAKFRQIWPHRLYESNQFVHEFHDRKINLFGWNKKVEDRPVK